MNMAIDAIPETAIVTTIGKSKLNIIRFVRVYLPLNFPYSCPTIAVIIQIGKTIKNRMIMANNTVPSASSGK